MESDLNDFEFWPDFDAPNFILEALDVDERFGDRVVPGVGLNDEGQEVFLQIWNAFLEALRIDQSLLEVFGRRQTWLDLFSAVCNVISEKQINYKWVSLLNLSDPILLEKTIFDCYYSRLIYSVLVSYIAYFGSPHLIFVFLIW